MRGPVIVERLDNGYRLQKPDNCPEAVYTLMKKCWEYKYDYFSFKKSFSTCSKFTKTYQTNQSISFTLVIILLEFYKTLFSFIRSHKPPNRQFFFQGPNLNGDRISKYLLGRVSEINFWNCLVSTKLSIIFN